MLRVSFAKRLPRTARRQTSPALEHRLFLATRPRERAASPPPLPRVCAVRGGRCSSQLATSTGRRRRVVARSFERGREGEGDVASEAGAGRMQETAQRDRPVRTQLTPPLFSLTLLAAAHILLLFTGYYSLSEGRPRRPYAHDSRENESASASDRCLRETVGAGRRRIRDCQSLRERAR